MNQYVADTHALYWHLTDSPRLGAQAKAAFEDADRGNTVIHVPVIVLAELYYMNVKLGQPLDFGQELQRLHASSQFVLVSLEPDDLLDLDIDVAMPEMHDRIIVGVARRLGAPLLTRDASIVASGQVTVVW